MKENLNGASRYEHWHQEKMQDPQFRAVYEEEAANKAIWFQLVEARLSTRLTQAELAQRLGTSPSLIGRIESRPLSFTPATLARYVAGLGENFFLEIMIKPGK